NVKVLYDWKPPVCMDCEVFGHARSNCPKNETIKVNIDCGEKTKPMVQKVNIVVNKDGNDGFVKVRSKKNGRIDYKMKIPNYKANPQSNKGGNNVKNVYHAKKKNQVEKEKSPVQTPVKEPEKRPKSVTSSKKWDLKNMEMVDGFLNKKITPTEKDMNRWDADMITYYKLQMEKLVDKGEGNAKESKEEDVLEEINEIAKNMKENDVKGMDGEVLGCRILVGWNDDEVSVLVIHMARQYVLLEMKTSNNTKLYGSFIYAANGGIEMKELWKDLEIYRRIVGKDPWSFSGDINVTLNPNEHSVRGSNMSSDMKDFKNCVNKIEVEDINSSGLFFTWTKNLHKAREGSHTGILKKVAKRIKNLKKPLKKLTWENGNVFENVKSLRDSVKEVQQKIDKDPHNKDLRSKEVDIIKEYSEAMKEEEFILYQKAKVKWLSVGDRNNAYLHKAIKNRQHRNRIDAVCDENGKRFEGSDVVEQFVMHF
nr:RNA-directed DNA polymerase, eukaryota, reverse transcriptase zinc-binding domain protein [Tanacetum cinerariifolium]